MNDELEIKINAIFASRDKKQAEQAATTAELRRKTQDFNDRFKGFAARIADPAMRYFKEILHRKGFGSVIVITGIGGDDRNRDEPSISFEIRTDSGGSGNNPHLRFQARSEMIHVHESTISAGRSGVAQSIGSFKIEDLTEEKIKEMLLKHVEQIFNV